MSCFANAGLAQTQDGAWEGPYSPIPDHATPSTFEHCCEIAHAILIAKPGLTQGKVLLIQSNGKRWMWDPAAPNSVGTEAYCDMIPPDDNMFCAGHSADSSGDIVMSGGARDKDRSTNTCSPQPRYSYVYDSAAGCWSANYPMLVPSPALPDPNFHNLGYYYPSTVRLPDGRVGSFGGGSDPLTTDPNNPNVPSGTCGDTGWTYFVDGWQILDRTTSTWIGAAPTMWFPGLVSSYTAAPGVVVPIQFNFYPLLMLMRSFPTTVDSGYVFAAVVTDNRNGNYLNAAGFVPKRSPSAVMSLGAGGPTTWAWGVHPSQINRPGTSTPRNLYYPGGFQWPMHLDGQGLPTEPPRFVVLGGSDQNDYLTGTQVSPGNPHPNGGRPALAEVQSIDNPESPSAAWTTGALPPLNIARIFTNAVVLPDEQLFVVGGSEFNFRPFVGQLATNVWMRERIASPIFFPEMIDLANVGGWVVCQQHVSPRLYHCIALLLPDGRVLVCGGYRGKKPAPNTPIGSMLPEELTWHNWKDQHSDIEIYSPDYLLVGSARPQILSITGGNTIGYHTSTGTSFEVTMAFPGQGNPAQAIGSVCLISPGSLTHHYDWDQRFVGLTFTVTATNKLSIVAPADPNVAPPGMYMLFITSNPALTGGVKIPSVAAYVNLQ